MNLSICKNLLLVCHGGTDAMVFVCARHTSIHYTVYILYTVEFSPAAIGSVLIRRFRLFVVINSVVGADFDFDPVDSF